VREEGVRPLHFSLHWDGSTLRIADTYGAGDVRVDDTPVTAQWRSLVGRVRIDFGKAAMVAETSSAARPESVHPPEPSPLPQIGGGVSVEPASSQRLHKATLIGVSLPKAGSLSADEADAQGKASDSGAPAGHPAGFRVVRPSDSERARTATLLGIAVSVPPPPGVPQEAKPATPAKGLANLANRTLLGVAVPLEARLQLLSGLSGQSTEQGGGVSMDDLRSGGAATPPGSTAREATNGAVTQAEVRSVSAAPREPPERIGSSWQEMPERRPTSSSRPPMAVLTGPPELEPFENEGTHAAQPGPDHERYSDAPTTMRDAASLESRNPKEAFPWRYVGIGLLTAAAYFAWLYLLDHL
jgi:hypothetical protein